MLLSHHPDHKPFIIENEADFLTNISSIFTSVFMQNERRRGQAHDHMQLENSSRVNWPIPDYSVPSFISIFLNKFDLKVFDQDIGVSDHENDYLYFSGFSVFDFTQALTRSVLVMRKE